MWFVSDFGSNCLSTIAIASVVVLIYLHYKKNYSFWKSKGVKGPTPLPLVGNSLDLARYDFVTLYMDNAQKYGKIYGYYEGSRHVLSVAEPEIFKQLFIKDFNIFGNRRDISGLHDLFDKTLATSNRKRWKKLRSFTTPAFSSGKIKRMKSLIERCARDATDFIEELAEKKEEMRVKEVWGRFTTQVICCCCFATSINVHKDPKNAFLRRVITFAKGSPLFFALYLALPSWLLRCLPIELYPGDTVQFIKGVVLHILKKRKEEGANYNDFIKMLVEAEKENKDRNVEPLTEDEVVAQCTLFFAVGYEPVATLLHWCCYALAMNPKVQENVYNEIKTHFHSTEEIEYEILNKLPYFDAFISETMRMYPPAVNTERLSSEEVEIGDTGIKIPANTLVNIPIYAIHHDADYYDEPETFKPERFLNENKENLVPYSYLPFGLGPRNCVGMRFAIMQAKLALIHTIFKFKLSKSSNTPVNLQFRKLTNQLIPTTEVLLNVEKR